MAVLFIPIGVIVASGTGTVYPWAQPVTEDHADAGHADAADQQPEYALAADTPAAHSTTRTKQARIMPTMRTVITVAVKHTLITATAVTASTP